MKRKELFLNIEGILKANMFKKKGEVWNRTTNEIYKWVIDFQKGKSASKDKFDMTVNVGVYMSGTKKLLFNIESDFAIGPDCFFRARPRFFGLSHEWWDFDLNIDNSSQITEIESLLNEKIFPFLNNNKNYDSLISFLPIEKWEKNSNFHSELLRVGVGYYIVGNIDRARATLQIVLDGGTIWTKKAQDVLNLIKH